MREFFFQLFQRRVETLIADFIAPVGAAGKQEPPEVFAVHHRADLRLEFFGRKRRDHRLQNACMAVLTIKRTGAARHGKRRKAVFAAAFKLAGAIGFESRCREPQRPVDDGSGGGFTPTH